MSELPASQARATPFERFWWHVVGFHACLVRGKLGLFPILCAQYRLETGNGDSYSFKHDKNGFGMHYPAPGAVAGRPGDGGQLAVFPSYWACWISRLGWDERHNVKPYTNVSEYVANVSQAGYNTSAAYPTTWLAVWEQQSALFNLLGMSRDGTSLFGRILTWLFVVSVLLGLVALVVWLVWRAFTKKNKSK